MCVVRYSTVVRVFCTVCVNDDVVLMSLLLLLLFSVVVSVVVIEVIDKMTQF